MPKLKTSFWLPNWVIEGLKSNEFERAGSIIREADTKQIIYDYPRNWEIKEIYKENHQKGQESNQKIKEVHENSQEID